MDFIDEVKMFSQRVENMKDGLLTEEATKTAVIMPFFTLLGYDVFNPQEFVPEFTLEAFFIVRSILKQYVPVSDIVYKDNEKYMTIMYKGKTTKWICRLYFNGAHKKIAIADENKKEQSFEINDIYDIEQYGDKLAETLQRYM